MYKLLYFVTGTIANFINMDYNTISDLEKMSRNVYYEINNKNKRGNACLALTIFKPFT